MPDERAKRLAELLRAIEHEEVMFAEIRKNHRDYIEKLRNGVSVLREEILTGQGNLLDAMQATADLVNSGALDTKDVKVTAEVTV
jgi:hypothetical protein